jgi:hypothetical protein
VVPSDAEQLTEGWIKLTPKSALEPGEYAVTELLGKEGMNSYVWDFGVHSNAPANLSVIRPDQSDIRQSSQQPAQPASPEEPQKRP